MSSNRLRTQLRRGLALSAVVLLVACSSSRQVDIASLDPATRARFGITSTTLGSSATEGDAAADATSSGTDATGAALVGDRGGSVVSSRSAGSKSGTGPGSASTGVGGKRIVPAGK